ncbi:MAG: 5-methyltetrahydropteroyltriglutamate--homocysteine S-methyltransferase, partial [Anaerolineales bacterium]
MTDFLSQTIGYPRIGRRRELKRALEGYWAGKLSETDLVRTQRQVEEDGWRAQRQAGISRVGIGDTSLYDPVLDWSIRFGAVPERHRRRKGLARTFALARGAEGAPALELTKWFDTNYHYLVPEIDGSWEAAPDFDEFLDSLRRGAEFFEGRAVPIVLGPLTFLRLSRLQIEIREALARLLPAYLELVRRLRDLRPSISEVQLHEPALALPQAEEDRPLYELAYGQLGRAGLPIHLVTYFDDLGESFAWVSRLPVAGIGLDFTRGDNLSLLRRHDWPEGTVLSAGAVDSRSVWRLEPEPAIRLLEELRERIPVRVSTSSSLQFLPYTVQAETTLPASLRDVLAFADEKLNEVRLLASYLSGEDVTGAWADARARWGRFRSEVPARSEIRERLRTLGPRDFARALPYPERRPAQIPLPAFPTTTIGSFPQTREIRTLRRRLKDGQLGDQDYRSGIDSAIRHTIEVQEELGLDVLVHGEFERSDMVEYFAERLDGFAITENGWVQS